MLVSSGRHDPFESPATASARRREPLPRWAAVLSIVAGFPFTAFLGLGAVGVIVESVMYSAEGVTIAQHAGILRNGLRATFTALGIGALIGVPLTVSGIRALQHKPRWPGWAWLLNILVLLLFILVAGWLGTRATAR